MRNYKGDPPAGGIRSEISSFTVGSKRRLRWAASNASPPLVSQFSMTYHRASPDGYTVKRHLHAFIGALKRRVGCGYLWILEFQSRGTPHFHIWLTLPVDTPQLHYFLADAWHRIAEPESPEHLKFHSHKKNFISWEMGSGAYLCKYLDKSAQKSVPHGFVGVGRFWGGSRNLVGPPDVVDMDGVPEPLSFIRTVCKHHEKSIRWSKWKSHARRSSCSYRLPNGAQVARQLLDVESPPRINNDLTGERTAPSGTESGSA